MTGAISLVDFAAQTSDQRKSALVQKITNESVFLRVLKFVPVDGFSYHYAEQATLGGVAFRSLNGDYSADAGVVNPKVEILKVFGGIVKTDRQIVNKRGDGIRANSIMAKVKAAGLFYDRYVIHGDPAVDPLHFYGLKARLAGSQVVYAGANGAQLELNMVDTLIDRVHGPNEQKVLVMNKACRRKFKQLIMAAAGGAAVSDVGGSLKSYDGVTIEVIDEDGDATPILGFNETRGSSAVTTSMYCIRPGDDVEGSDVQGLVGSNMIEQADGGMQGNMLVDIVEANMGLGVFHGRAAAMLAGVLAPPA